MYFEGCPETKDDKGNTVKGSYVNVKLATGYTQLGNGFILWHGGHVLDMAGNNIVLSPPTGTTSRVNSYINDGSYLCDSVGGVPCDASNEAYDEDLEALTAALQAMHYVGHTG